ncbi:MAG: glycosyltransferase family 4 protein [Clostridia bacterium]|nr:glycosyltransferase family 4 protein [Clostridia bacterium]
MKKKILIISNSTAGLVNFRSELIGRLCKEYEVIVLAPYLNWIAPLEALGCKVINFKFDGHGTNPIKELSLIKRFKQQIKSIDPMIVLTYTIKPNVYAGAACASLNIPYIANVTGLGDAIENPGVVSAVAKTLYKRGLRKATKVFFQNKTNCETFLAKGLYSGEYDVIPGSGVNLGKHVCEPYPASDDPLVFSVIGRVTKDKGIDEVLAAADRLSDKNIIIRLIGNCMPEYIEKLKEAEKKGVIKFEGRQENIHDWYRETHAVLHASYHEGMSNVLLEAASCGRPVLASNIPGCVEAFDEGVSGFGFKPMDVDSLVDAALRFIALPHEKKAEMGLNGRKKVEAEFDRNIVVDRYMSVIKKIEGESKK